MLDETSSSSESSQTSVKKPEKKVETKLLRLYKIKKGERRGDVVPQKELISAMKPNKLIIFGEDGHYDAL